MLRSVYMTWQQAGMWPRTFWSIIQMFYCAIKMTIPVFRAVHIHTCIYFSFSERDSDKRSDKSSQWRIAPTERSRTLDLSSSWMHTTVHSIWECYNERWTALQWYITTELLAQYTQSYTTSRRRNYQQVTLCWVFFHGQFNLIWISQPILYQSTSLHLPAAVHPGWAEHGSQLRHDVI